MTKKEIIERHIKLIEHAYSQIIILKSCNDRLAKGENLGIIYEKNKIAAKLYAKSVTQLFKESFELINK